MPGGKNLGKDEIGAIIALQKVGTSQRKIAKQLGIAQSTVHLWCKRADSKSGPGTPTQKIKPGRPRNEEL